MGSIKCTCNVSVKLPINDRLVRIHSIKTIFWSKLAKKTAFGRPFCSLRLPSAQYLLKLFGVVLLFSVQLLLYISSIKNCFFHFLQNRKIMSKLSFSRYFYLCSWGIDAIFFKIENFYLLNQQISGVSFEMADDFSWSALKPRQIQKWTIVPFSVFRL